MLSERWGIFTDIHCNIQELSFYGHHELCLGEGFFLVMKAPYHALHRRGNIVLYIAENHSPILKHFLSESLQKVPPLIIVDSGLDDICALYIRFNKLHSSVRF